MGGLWCCIPDILSFLKEKLWPMPTSKLPEELMLQIFSRMPAECIHRYAKVYKDWNSLLTSPYFTHNLFLPSTSPTIIVYHSSIYVVELFYIHNHCEDNRKIPIRINLKEDPLFSPATELVFSCYGLLFYNNPCDSYTIILNPITCEKLYLLHFCEGKSEICGVFFHPTAKEYRLLLVCWFDLSPLDKGFNYLEFKLLRAQGLQRRWTTSKYMYLPSMREPPVNMHGALHWMRAFPAKSYSQSIIVFSMVEEEFKLMPQPKDVSLYTDKHLFDFEGKLSLCHIVNVLEIWTLEDYNSWLWTKTHSIRRGLLDNIWINDCVKVLGIQNGALIIVKLGEGVLVYDLQQNTSKMCTFDKLEVSASYSTVCLHTKSLASVRDFQQSSEKYKQLLATIRKRKLEQRR